MRPWSRPIWGRTMSASADPRPPLSSGTLPGVATPLLEVRGLEVTYDDTIAAVRAVDLALAAGELGCLIGANGAGKSSTLNAIAGVVRTRGGEIHVAGTNLTRLPPHRRVGAGVALVPEGRGIFARLSVAENLRLGAYARRDTAAVARDLAEVLARIPRLAERLDQTAGTLSGGEQQMLAIGRALLSRPRLLLLDEPSMGLAPRMVDTVFGLIAGIARSGVTILLVEQNARLALDLADRAWVMESGRITLSGPAATLREDTRVRTAYLGELAGDEHVEDGTELRR